jgi:hypothetical protein
MSARNTKKIVLFLVVTVLFGVNSRAASTKIKSSPALKMLEVDSVYNQAKSNFDKFTTALYRKTNAKTLSYEAFQQGVIGYLNMVKRDEVKIERYLTIIDFSKPSTDERLFIFDVCSQTLVYQSIVSHGRNSGGLYATKFSNSNNSHQSSLGFYKTTSTYHSSKYKLALRLDGLEHSNNKASSRGVVMHGADYATYDFLKKNGSLGRSYGCPAMPYENFDQVVSWIKHGSCMYIYYPSKSYQRYSKYLNRKNYLEDFIEA